MTVYQIIISYQTDIDKSHLGTVTRTKTEADDWLSTQIEQFKNAFYQIYWKDNSIEGEYILLNGDDNNFFYATINQIEI